MCFLSGSHSKKKTKNIPPVCQTGCGTSTSPLLQVPSDLVHREPLHCASAEEDGRVFERGAPGQTESVRHQHTGVQEAALTRDAEGEGFSQG